MLPHRCVPALPLFVSAFVLAVAVASASAENVDVETAYTVQTVTAATLDNMPTCARVLSDIVNIAPAPMVNVGKSTLNIRGLPEGASLLDGLQIRTSDGRVHPAIDPICVDNVEILKGPAEAIYGGDAVAGVVNFVTSSRPSSSAYGDADYSYNFFAEPFLNPSQMQVIRGPFDTRWPGTSVDVGGKPGLILAETPDALFWQLPEDAPSGSVTITITDAGRGARFPVYILGLAMSADHLKLLKGQSTAMQATVFGPELIPPDAWKAGDMSWTLNLKLVAELFPGFKIPKPGDPGVLFFRVDNSSRETVSMKPSKNESHIVSLTRGDFASGPYTYNARLQSKKAGGFSINGLVVGFFAPIPGEPWTPPALGAGFGETPAGADAGR